MNITALFHKHSPFQSIQMPRRGCPRLREHVEHTRMQGTQLLWYPRSNHTWRLHNSGFGCHPEPLIWDSRSFLTGIDQGDATSRSVWSGNRSWFGQFGAMSITEAPLFFSYIYSLAAGQCDVSASPFSGEWDREKNSRQCAFSSSWRTDPPPLPRSESKSSEPTQGAISTLLEESPSSKACPPCGSEDWGCALLWLRESDGPHIAGDSLHACWIVRLLGDLCTKTRAGRYGWKLYHDISVSYRSISIIIDIFYDPFKIKTRRKIYYI